MSRCPAVVCRFRKSLIEVRLLCLVAALGCASASIPVDDGIRVLEDLPYKTSYSGGYDRIRCKLDLYLPAAGEGFATIVWFHGGGLNSGDKRRGLAVAVARHFAGEGIAVASVNYRIKPYAKFPGYIEDAAAAVAFVRSTIAQYGGSPQRIFVSGHSAGGYLAAMVGVDGRYLEKHGLGLRDIAGVIPVSGHMITHERVQDERGIPEMRPIIDEAAPCYYARADTAPFLNIVGSRDVPARAEENRYFVAVMKAAGHGDVTYLEVEGRDHRALVGRIDEADDDVAVAIRSFIERLKP